MDRIWTNYCIAISQLYETDEFHAQKLTKIFLHRTFIQTKNNNPFHIADTLNNSKTHPQQPLSINPKNQQMHWLIITQIITSILYVAYLLHNYSLRTVGPFVKFSVYLTWLICFSNVILLPYDVYFALKSNYQLTVVWTVSYGLIFFLTWLLLPIAQEYEEAGEFSIKDKLKRAIINNLIIYGVFLGVGLIGLGYLIISQRVDLKHLPPVMLAASNAFGMFLVVIFLSYGLTAIPRVLWRNKNYKLKLKKLQFDASNLMRKKSTVLEELELRVKEVLWKIKRDGESLETNQVLNIVPSQYIEKWNKKIPDLGQVNPIKLHKQIKNLILQLSRLDARWQQLSISAFKIQDIMTYLHSSQHRIESTIFNHYKYEILNYGQWVWHCQVKRVVVPVSAIVLGAFAGIIVIAEIAVFVPAVGFLNPFSHLTLIQEFVWIDLVQLLILGYMAFCIYYALFKLKFSNFYGLYWNKQTDAASLIFFAINCSRITNPLNYNFLQIIHDSDTSFVKAMGQTPLLGKTLQIIFPVLIIILIIFNIFDVYSRICKRIGLSKFQFQPEFSHQNIEQGRKLLQKARTDLQTKILNSNCKNLAQFRSYKSEVIFQGIPTMAMTDPNLNGPNNSNKESISSDALHLKPNYFNQYRDMEKVIKIFEM